MNIDFHYYATYLAARIAGYTVAEAKTIAYAAQYVDVSGENMIDKKLLEGLPETTATIEDMGKLLRRDTDWYNVKTRKWKYEEKEIKESEVIWRSFHFLPGNIHPKDDRKYYSGKRKYSKTVLGIKVFGEPEYGQEEARAFSLMCQPDSVLSEKMVNDVQKYKNQPCYLEMVGIRMHVLADTWAHCYFAGTPSWWVNEAPENVESVDDNGERKRLEYSILKNFTINIKKYVGDNYFFATPPMLSFKSFSYLGHGRMGGVPDVPFMHYTYKPKWSNGEVIKNNQAMFLLAFRQMVYAMKCIREGTYYRRNRYPELEENLKTALREVFAKTDYTASKAAEFWQPVIDRFYQEEAEELGDFKDDAWKEEAKESADKEVTNYYRFNYAAVMHRQFVTSYVEGLWNLGTLPASRWGIIDAADVVMLKKEVMSDAWQWASNTIRYLGHDREPWTAEYKNGWFYLYKDSSETHCHISQYLDYLGEDGKRYTAVVGIKVNESGEITGNVLNILSLDDGEEQENWHEVSEIAYMDWNRRKCRMTLTCWENVDSVYLSGKFMGTSLKLFVCEREGQLTISPRIHYLSVKDDGGVEEQIFEHIFKKNMRPQEYFNVNTEENREQNLITPSIFFSTDGSENHKMEISAGEFWIDEMVQDDVTIRDWDGKEVKLHIIQWDNE